MSSIDRVLQDAVAAGAVPQVVAMAADRDGLIYEGAAGPRAAGSDDQVSPDTHFRIMSMTKMVATVAALQQMEQGNLDLDAPIDSYCPTFADVQVLDGFDGDTPRLRPPASRATVKQLMTHTTGLGYWFWSAELQRWEAATGTPPVLSGSNVIFTAPMLADPGTRFEYGINIDWLGKVVEAASGVTLDVAIKDGITGPLGMDETAFAPTVGQRADLAPIHVQGEDGAWVATEIDLNPTPDYWAGGHGLHSTPRDYLRFQQALLHDGAFEGTKILEPSTVDAAFTNQIGELDFPPAIPTADPASTLRVQPRAWVQVRLRAVAQHRGHPRPPPGVERGVGGAVQHPLLGRPHRWHHRRHLQPVPAVRAARRAAAVRRLRSRHLRQPLTRPLGYRFG